MKLSLLRMPQEEMSCSALAELREDVALADRLGLHMAYLPGLPGGAQILADLAETTDRIKIGLDATAFSNPAPSALTKEFSKLNTSLDGRLCLGVPIGCDASSTKSRAAAQTLETLLSDVPLPCGAKAAGRYPMSPPRPDVLGLPQSGSAKEAAQSAARGYRPVSPSWLPPRDVARHWPAIVAGATHARRRACPTQWHVARTIVISEDRATIASAVRAASSPIRRYYERLLRLGIVKARLDDILDTAVIAGSAAQVTDRLFALEEAVGQIGTLQYVMHAGGDRTVARASLRQMTDTIMPALSGSTPNKAKELERI